MTRSQLLLLVTSWGAAFAALGVLLATFRPPVPSGGERLDVARPPAAPPSSELANTIELPPIVIVAARPRRAARPGAEATRRSAPTCAAFRPLVQGDVTQRVRACE